MSLSQIEANVHADLAANLAAASESMAAMRREVIALSPRSTFEEVDQACEAYDRARTIFWKLSDVLDDYRYNRRKAERLNAR